MKTITYNKLVRDKIPEIITKNKKSCICEILTDDKYLEMLDQKLTEECTEYQESKSLEELADILEVIHAITKARGYTLTDLENKRIKKSEKNGAFGKKILLKEVIESHGINP